MPFSSYQVERLIRSLKRVQRIEQAERDTAVDGRAALWPAGAPPEEPAAAPAAPPAIADRTPLPNTVRLEMERRAGSFMRPPPGPGLPPIPKVQRAPRPPKPPSRSLGEGD